MTRSKGYAYAMLQNLKKSKIVVRAPKVTVHAEPKVVVKSENSWVAAGNLFGTLLAAVTGVGACTFAYLTYTRGDKNLLDRVGDIHALMARNHEEMISEVKSIKDNLGNKKEDGPASESK